jgi:hypothetical protein
MLAGCSSGSSSSTGTTAGGNSPTAGTSSSAAAADPLAATSIASILSEARANTIAAQSVSIAGTGTSSGQKISLDLTYVHGVGCSGSVTQAGTTAKITLIGTKIWLNAPPMPAGQYTSGKASDATFQGAASICSLSGLLGSLTASSITGATKTVTTLDGQPVVDISGKDKKTGSLSTAVVADTVNPVLLEVIGRGSDGGTLNFTGYGATKTLTPPAGG